MPIFTVPLHEFNPCHEPSGSGKGGQFAPVGTCDENPVDWKAKAPERARAVYGGTLDPDEVPTLEEAEKFAAALLGAKEGYWDRGQIKAHLAGEFKDALTTVGYSALFDALREKVKAHVEDDIGESLENDVDIEQYRDDYEEFVEGRQEEIDTQHYEAARDEFVNQREKYIEETQEQVEDLHKIWAEEEAKIRAEGGPIYGDLEGQLDLPGETWSPRERVVDPLVIINAEEPDEIRERFNQAIREGKVLGDTTPESITADHEYFDENDDSAFDNWREREFGEADYSDIPSFESWVEDQGYQSQGTYPEDEALASYLLHQWAESSGNRHLVSVALQRAAEDAFNLQNSYTGVFTAKSKYHGSSETTDAFTENVDAFYEAHKRPLKAFVRAMYAHTQQRLTEMGIPEDGYVTVYRGFTLLKKAAPGLETVDLARGEFVDLRLQPLSSFTIAFDTARDFVGHGQKYVGANEGESTYSLMSAVRVPRSRVLSTYVTGFGAKGEYEVVLLGGKYTSFIRGYTDDDRYQKAAFGESIASLAHQRLPKGPVAPPLPGDRF